MDNPIKVKLSLVIPTLTKLTFTASITDTETTLNSLAKHIFETLTLPSYIGMEFYSDEGCKEMCMGTTLNDG